jgi:hypothetical protein
VTVTLVFLMGTLPAPSAPDMTAASDTGTLDTDNITRNNTPTFTGTAGVGLLVSLREGGAVLGTATANSAGIWTITSTILTDGIHNLTATASDLAGHVSDPSSPLSVTIDTVAPTLTASLDKPAALTGWYNLATGAPTATFAGSDSGSGLAGISAPFTFGAGSHLSATAAVTDIAGNSTNRFVTYSNLAPDQGYTMIINATNATGSVTVTQNFYTFTSTFVLYDSRGFTNDTLYPVGPLQNVTDGLATWSPNAAEPAQIVDVGDPWGKVLQRQDTGLSRADFLDFPPVSAGIMTIEFDGLSSITTARTIDICLQPLNAAGTTMGCFLTWGEPAGKLFPLAGSIGRTLAQGAALHMLTAAPA